MKVFSITNGTRGTTPRVPFSRIAETIMPKKYTLSLVFVGDTRMRRLNNMYRKKNEPTDILSFSLSNDTGEMFINEKVAAQKARAFELTKLHYLTYVFIHGLLHLKGLEHGRTMEQLEDTWCKKFGVPAPRR